MGKNLNPADAYRKAQRKKELKKNKAERSKARDFALVKKDTTDLENAIKELEESRSDANKLAELKAELESINRKKAEYVEEHPEQRRLVYRRRKEGEPEPDLPTVKQRNLFKKNGLPRHPERSIYYDSVMNPFGVAPPGMPYLERPLRPDEIDSDAEMEDGDEAIPLPPNVPPGTEEVQNDDDIPMPEGPPPWAKVDETINPPLPSPPQGQYPPPPPPMLSPSFLNPGLIPPPPSLPNVGIPPPFPPPPHGFPAWNVNIRPPPGGFPPFPGTFPPFPPNAYPAPPRNFLPRQQSLSSMQDPLSSTPHQTFQAHRASQLAPPHPSLPANPSQTGSNLPVNPSLPAKPSAAAELAAATVYSAPQLRDLKKEATAFVPSALKRKKVAPAVSSSKLDAAPTFETDEAVPQDDKAVRPDLVSAIKNQFGSLPMKPAPSSKIEQPKSDYDKFIEDMDDILGDK